MQALLDLLDAGGVSLATAAARLGLTEGRALAALVQAGRTVRIDGEVALATLRGWGRIRVILRAGGSVAEVPSDLGAARERGAWLDDEDDRVRLRLDTSELAGAYVTAKAAHANPRTVRMVAFVDGRDEVLFKVMVPKERADLVDAFNRLRGKA